MQKATEFLSIFLLVVLSDIALALEVSGTIAIEGHAAESYVILTNGTDTQQKKSLCRNDKSYALRAFVGFVVSVDTADKNTAEGKGSTDCLEVADFKFLKTPFARRAIVGVFELQDSGYVLKTVEGDTYTFSDIPKNLRVLMGRKIILDLKQLAGPGSDQSYSRIVSYYLFPN